MISAVGSVGNPFSLYALQLSVQGLQARLIKKAQQNGQTQSTTDLQNPDGTKNSIASAMNDLKEDAIQLAQSLGALVSPNEKVEDILDTIYNTIARLQDQTDDLQQLNVLSIYQAQYSILFKMLSILELAQDSSQISMNGLK